MSSEAGPNDATRVDEAVPTVSIGLAVYNGEEFIEEAIDSILAQTFTDFELIISDNASTDRTAEICQRYAAADPRIRYHRNSENIGGARNENQTFVMSRGRYFRWAAYDDLLAPTLLERCIEVLEARPDAVLCYPATVEIDESGTPTYTNYEARGTTFRASERFAELAFRNHGCEATYGLMRPECLRRTPLQEQYTDSDRVLLCELALMGPFATIAEPLFFKRYHRRNVYVDWRSRMAWFDPALAGRPVLPNWLALAGMVRMLHRSAIGRAEMLRCYVVIGRWASRYSLRLVKDLGVAGRTVLVLSLRPNPAKHETNNWE